MWVGLETQLSAAWLSLPLLAACTAASARQQQAHAPAGARSDIPTAAEAASPRESATEAKAGPALGEEQRLTLNMLGTAIEVKFRPPAGWTKVAGRVGTWQPPQQPDPDHQEVIVSLSAECKGSCAPSDLVESLSEYRMALREPQAKFEDGEVSATAMRDIPHDADAADGWILVQRERFNEAELAAGSGRWHNRIRVVRVLRRPSDRFFIECSGVALLKREGQFASAMRAACETAVILEASKAQND